MKTAFQVGPSGAYQLEEVIRDIVNPSLSLFSTLACKFPCHTCLHSSLSLCPRALPVIINKCIPQGCVLNPLLFSLFTHDTNIAACGTLALWCQDHNLSLNVGKAKEVIVNHRRIGEGEGALIHVNGTVLERISCSFGCTSTMNLSDLPTQRRRSNQLGNVSAAWD